MQLKDIERDRYQRQMMLPGIGKEGQLKLKKAKVLIVGVGGLGSPVAAYLCAAGVGVLGLVDDDVVAESNLQRQILYNSKVVGKLKVHHAQEVLQTLNPEVEIDVFEERISAQNAEAIFQKFDVIVDATDNFRSRYLISQFCQQFNKPMVHGSIEEFSGMVSVFNYMGGPVYEDLFPEPPQNTPIDGEPKGVFGALPGIIGSLQSMEVLKILAGVGESLSGKLLTYDALAGRFNTLKMI
ncbi:HesA/MoeB/ThiF family protein [Sunxiuqinia indica]|uniref:HesA/MoeB/ThiF family protein n=1 Tax=Sunxiuqinia indica TaxID=2692584 RepID=UPI00135A5328|nr:HesA/MoeB/ThiF family protein [Sunxiuqinia indica]